MPVGLRDCKWLLSRTNREYVDYVSGITGFSTHLAQVLINRGIKTSARIDSFLNPDLTKLSDPFDLPGMSGAVARIREAANRGERVLVHGDYDADGITATAIMTEALRRHGIDAQFYIPNRVHGYGLGHEGIKSARDCAASLIVTVDCGITSFAATAEAVSLGIDVIVTDHHEPATHNAISDGPGTILLPSAVAIVNPKLAASPSGNEEMPAAELSGAGVALKLAQALLGNDIENVRDLFDLAALGTAADIVPVTGDNRIILKEGLSLIQSGERAGIRALKEIASVKAGALRTSTLHYMLVPRINAAGRISDATDVVNLLLTDSSGEAARLAEWVDGLNQQRQEIGESVYSAAMEMVQALGYRENGDSAIVVAGHGWHRGVLGIAAARIAEAFYRPAFVLSIEDGTAKGSARSIPPFDIHEGLRRCSGILKRFGGHKQAAGLSLSAADIEVFREQISGIVRESVQEDDLVPVLRIDAQLNLSDVTMELVREIAGL
ncbi:MAG TPA: single-stranded-DNA-specific exonuclease RecJ, partial [Dissulfurispiraceae bacterium]|nr:single-stranded-DNA-specific exonuclease RecJ [Dissulfurispiraceae bacterium]